MANLLNYALDNKISFKLTSSLSSDTPSAALVSARMIVINLSYKDPQQLPFQVAHEIGHIMCDDNSDSVLYFTPTKSKTEFKANDFAIRLLVKLFIEDEEKNHTNLYGFMNFFKIPYHLENIVSKELLNVFK